MSRNRLDEALATVKFLVFGEEGSSMGEAVRKVSECLRESLSYLEIDSSPVFNGVEVRAKWNGFEREDNLPWVRALKAALRIRVLELNLGEGVPVLPLRDGPVRTMTRGKPPGKVKGRPVGASRPANQFQKKPSPRIVSSIDSRCNVGGDSE